MKVLLKDSSMEFSPARHSGDVVPVTPLFVSPYEIGSGYYLTTLGRIAHLNDYDGKLTGVSALIPVVGFSKLKIEGVINNPYHAIAAFFSTEEQTEGTNSVAYSDSDTIIVDIPAGALFFRAGSNSTGQGTSRWDAVFSLIV